MKVFNLKCENEHVFEGWFASGDAFTEQQQSGVLECPVCATPAVRRMPSAARLNLSGAPAPCAPSDPPKASERPQARPTPADLRRLLARVASIIQNSTEDVGDRFVEEARRIHYNEAPERGIRGVATREQAAELADEGIDVMPFPLPLSDEGPLQ